MANKESETIKVDDETTLTLKPLKIYYLKKTMKVMDAMAKKSLEQDKAFEADEIDEKDPFMELDGIIEAAYEALQQDNGDAVEDTAWIEANLTQKELTKVLSVTAGFELDEDDLGN